MTIPKKRESSGTNGLYNLQNAASLPTGVGQAFPAFCQVHAHVRRRRRLCPELPQVMVRVLVGRHTPLLEREPAK
jgi:hypothetical protein